MIKLLVEDFDGKLRYMTTAEMEEEIWARKLEYHAEEY